MRSSIVAWALAGVGCGSVSGDPADAQPATPDAAVAPVPRSLGFDRVSIGASVETTALDVTEQPARYLVESAPGVLSEFPAVASTTGWAGETPPGDAMVEFTLPDEGPPIPRLWGCARRCSRTCGHRSGGA